MGNHDVVVTAYDVVVTAVKKFGVCLLISGTLGVARVIDHYLTLK